MTAHYEYDHDHGEVHTAPIAMMGMVMLASVALAASVSLGFVDRVAVPSETRAAAGVEAVDERSLFFSDSPDGAVIVSDAASGEEIARYDPGSGGFVRSTLRSLAGARRVRGIGPETPFDLTQWEDGSLTLSDETTSKSVELGSFGPDNRAIFAALLEREKS